MKYFLSIFLSVLSVLGAKAQTFDDFFVDKTLRIDYIFTGTATSEGVALDQLSQLPQWSGRKNNLSDVALKGNGQVKVTDVASGQCIYRDAFSTLFQEWQTVPESKTVTRSFENAYLIPFPKNKVEVEVLLRTKDGLYQTVLKHTVDPKDILIKKKGLFNIPTYSYTHKGDTTKRCINVVILAEGYTANEMPQFRQHAKTTTEQILAHTPFNKLQGSFNFIAVETISLSSGVSVPRTNEWKETAFSSHFDTFYTDRYLTSSHIKDIHDAIAGVPYSHIIILANTDVYGGGGIFNAYTLTTTGHSAFEPVVVHEFGHSFGGLADEYFYESDVFNEMYLHHIEPWEPNITTLIRFADKWKDMLPAKVSVPTNEKSPNPPHVGVYEGAGYSAKGIYRPAIDCRMKTNTCKDFCPVCQRALERLVKFYTE